MFNFECYKRKGTVLGTCIDGFLFGACCRLPGTEEKEEVEEMVEEEVEGESDDASQSSSADNSSDISSGVFIDKLDVESPVKAPSIILGNGSIVSLEKLTLKPDLYASSESPVKEIETNHLFTWYTIDQLLNSTTSKESPSKSDSTVSPSLVSTSTQDLPFLGDINFDFELEPIKTKLTSTTTKTSSMKTSTSPSSLTTTTEKASKTKSTITTTATSTSTPATTTTSTSRNVVTAEAVTTQHPIWPDPFLDLATTEQQQTLRSPHPSDCIPT